MGWWRVWGDVGMGWWRFRLEGAWGVRGDGGSEGGGTSGWAGASEGVILKMGRAPPSMISQT